jgi:Zn-dependent protease
MIVAINCSLTLLNLIPIPPLDGSKVFSAILPGALGRAYDTIRANLEHNVFLGFGLVLVFIYVLGNAYGKLVFALASLIAGV